MSDQLHLSQGILRKRENERDNVSLRNAVSLIVILTEFIQLHPRNEPLLLYPYGDTSAGGSLSFDDLETIGEEEEVLERHQAPVEELCDLITYLNLRLNKNSPFFSPEFCDVYIRISGLGNK
ncbi:hypothetical protein ALC57_12353 [Trachymyrmex cornetzi]|uniref:Uncharacterized protein n=1 Tax=Trachymyrmex cornetzi TaxID=471704 RepID=A0A195DS09_9HYME|nr:hypothetical protein ALC57_12353 [Trachymyrmex cornetzi]